MSSIMMGLFAFVIAFVSLWRMMAETEFYRLTMMKRVFGRSRGLAVHFVVTVAVPVVLGIVFLTGGVSGKNMTRPLQAEPTISLQPEKPVVAKPLPHGYLCFS